MEAPELPAGYRWGKDISPEEMQYERVAVSEVGRATAFLGYLDLDRHGIPFLYSICMGARGIEARKSRRFVRLEAGRLNLGGFLWDTQAYKILDERRIRLPSGADNSFGVFGPNWELDEALTRDIFGATFPELETFLEQFYATVRHPIGETWGWRPARITFSKTRDNDCDLSGLYIPKNFPFIAFGDTAYFGGHVSLAGFYRHLAFLCRYRELGGKIEGEAFFQSLVDSGAAPELIVRLCNTVFANGGMPLIDPCHAFRMMESLPKERPLI